MIHASRQTIVHLSVIGLIMTTALAYALCRPSDPPVLEGTLHYPMMNIGSEGSSAKLETAGGVYDLFFEPGPDHVLLDRLAGKPVRVVGRSFRARGIERRDYPAIRVIRITEF